MRSNRGGSDIPFDTKEMMRDFKAVAFFVKHSLVNGFERGKINRSINDIAVAALVFSQFTLEHDTSSSKRLEFSQAADRD